MDVDVQVDLLDACLLLPVPGSFMPRTVAHLGIFNLRQVETFPIAAW
jgi:hypothetical protein